MFFLSAQSLIVTQLVGHWSHGVAHGYYGGSHEYAIVLLADGRGSFIHDGWWTYRYASFRWTIDGMKLAVTQQRYREISMGMGNGRRSLQIEGPVSIRFDTVHQRERLDIPLVDEPNDFYLITRDVGEADLHLEHLADETAEQK